MKNFEYYAPRSLKEALSLLKNLKNDTKVLAGGTDLIVQMKEGSIRPDALIDVKNIPELNRLELEEDKVLHIGAAVPLSRVLAFSPIGKSFDILRQACAFIGSVQIKNRATIGGNICNAAPSADTVPALLCLGAKAILIQSNKTRKVSLEDFFTSPGQTVLTPGELLTEIEIPVPFAPSSGFYLRHTNREEMDISIVGAASFIVSGPNNICQKAKIALAAVAPTPIISHQAEAVLTGKVLTKEAIQEASEIAAKTASPISDIRASAEYRIEIIKVLTSRTLNRAWEALISQS